MKKLYAVVIYLLLCPVAFSQCTILPNAVQGISYVYVQGGGTNASGIAYNPNLNIYYAVIAGNPGFPYETFDAFGTSLYQTNAGFDFRGLWWNPNTNEVETTGFSNFGLWTSNLNGSGYALNTGTNIYTGQNQPDAQSCGDYDCQTNEIVYYFNGKIYRYQRANGAFISSYNLTGCPVPVGNWNTTSVVYTGCAGNEIGIEDYVGKNILLFNKATGAYSGMSALPASAVTNNSFRFSYANNMAWLYDIGSRKWTSYSIFSGTPNGSAIVNLGNDTTLCTGQSLLLDAGNPGATFLWQDGSTGQTLNITTTGIYSVSVNAGGCYFSHDTIKITFNSGSLSVNLGNDTSVCNGQPITLDATTPGAAYLWSTGANSNTISANSSGTYWVQVSANGCSARDTMVFSLANTSTTNVNVSICPNSTYTLPDGSIVSTAGTYIDTLAAVTGCDSIITTNLSVASFTIDAGNDTAICNGHSAQLNATGALIYSWTPALGLSDPNIANPIASPTTTTTYTVSSQSAIGNLITNGDFSAGNTGFASGYVYMPPPNNNQGQYWVSTNAQVWNGGMAACGDHSTGNGNMLLVNGATTSNASVYCTTVNVIPNTSYAFSTWLTTLTAGNLAQLQFSINGSLLGGVFTAPASLCTWQQFYQVWNSGASNTATICIVNQNTNAGANDFGLDDISFAPLCTGTDSVTVTVYPTFSNMIDASICQNEIYPLPDGTTTSTAGTYIDTLLTPNGCDIIITTNLTVNPSYAYSVSQTICPSDLYILPSGIPVNTTGVYIDTLSTVNGCDSIITTNLIVVPPSITVSNDTQVCLGSTVQLNASGGLLSYSWTPATDLSDPNIPNPVATPSQTTSYIVTTQVASGDLIGNGNFEGGNAGFSSSYVYQTDLTPEGTYYVGPNPNTYHSGFSACPDHTSGTGNMMIINGAGTPGLNIWCETINVVPSTNYAFGTWVSSVAAGSPAILQFQINGTLIGPPFNAPAGVCTWQQFYSVWNSGANTTANICIINQNTTLGGNDFAIDDISFIGLCNVSDTVTITVHNPSQTNIDTAICQGVTYTFPSGATSAISVIDTSLLFDQFGCDSVIITNLTVNPTYAVSVFDTICQGVSYTLPSGNTVNSSGVYVNSLSTVSGCDSIITTNLFVTPPPVVDVYDTLCSHISYTLPSGIVVSNAGNYTDTLTTVAGCDSVVITHLFVTPPPVTDVFDSICSNQTYTLPSGNTVSAAGSYTDTVNTTAGCDSVVIIHLYIKPNSATTVLDTICNGLFFTLPDGSNVSIAGNYPVILTNQYGCDSVVTTNLTVIQVLDSNTHTDELCNGGNTAGILSSASGGVSPYNYDLMYSGAIVSNNATGNFSSLPAGDYSVNATDDFGCTASSSITINEPSPLVISDSVNNVHCFGEDNGEISISANGGTPNYSFNLNNQSSNTTGIFTSLIAGKYTYTVTDANGCTDSSSTTVTEPQPVIINLNPDSVVINLGEVVQLYASTNYDPSTAYLWTPNIGLSCYTCPNPTVETYSTIDYRLEVTATINGNDCSAAMNVPVTVIPKYDIFIPNTFTPNGDGNNDFFQIFGNTPALKFIEVEIFNRWGEKIFESNDLNFKWDGNYKSKPLEPMVLVYTLRAGFLDNHSEKIYKGTLTLLK